MTLPGFTDGIGPSSTTMTSTSDVAGRRASSGRVVIEPVWNAPTKPGSPSAWWSTHALAIARACPARMIGSTTLHLVAVERGLVERQPQARPVRHHDLAVLDGWRLLEQVVQARHV